MANLLRIIVDLAEDSTVRAAFRDDPEVLLDGLVDVSGEDVDAAVRVAALQVRPEVAAQLEDLRVSRDPDASPRDEALAALAALCEAVELAGIISFPASVPRIEDSVVPDHPPGRTRPAHLRAVDGDAEAEAEDDDDGDAPTAGHDRSADVREHPSNTNLAPVPDPPGGFEFSVLEMVRLPEGLPDAGVEPGATGTVVAVHREPSLGYEIEVSGEDGGRLFLGVVPPSAVVPVTD